MNYRLLFRAKRADGGGWVTGFYGKRYLDDYKRLVDVIAVQIDKSEQRLHMIDTSTICQCTGLRDKNGTVNLQRNIRTRIEKKSRKEKTNESTRNQ